MKSISIAILMCYIAVLCFVNGYFSCSLIIFLIANSILIQKLIKLLEERSRYEK